MVSEMKVGQKVQAIIPPELAFGDKGKIKFSQELMIHFLIVRADFLTILSFFLL